MTRYSPSITKVSLPIGSSKEEGSKDLWDILIIILMVKMLSQNGNMGLESL